jgi:hypothetical protein
MLSIYIYNTLQITKYNLEASKNKGIHLDINN